MHVWMSIRWLSSTNIVTMKYMVCVDDSEGAEKALERTAQISKPEDHITLVSAYIMPSDQHVVCNLCIPIDVLRV